MAISTNGTFINSTGAAGVLTVSITATAVNDIIVLAPVIGGTGATITNLAGGNVTTWQQLVTPLSSAGVGDALAFWWGVTTSTGTNTLTYTTSASIGTHQIQTSGQEFKSSFGVNALWQVDGTPQSLTHGTATTTVVYPTLTPTAAGRLYFGGSAVQVSATAGATSGYTYQVDGFADVLCWNTSTTAAAQSPTANESSGQDMTVAALFVDVLNRPPPLTVARHAVTRAVYY